MARVLYLVTTVVLFITSWLLLLIITPVEGRRARKPKQDIPSPSFLLTESNYTYHKGERAILYCSIQNLGTKTVIWRRAINNSSPLTIGSMTYVEDDRYSVAHVDDSTDWNLMIANVSTGETGDYECQVAAVDRELRKRVHLHVKDEFSYKKPCSRPECITSDTPQLAGAIAITGTLHVDKGMPMTLVCNATGATTPPEYIDWFKDGSKITTNRAKRIDLTKHFSMSTRTISSTMVKMFADMKDTGTYVCRTSDLQVTSVKVNVLNTNKISIKRVLKDPLLDGDGQCIAHCEYQPDASTGEINMAGSASSLSPVTPWASLTLLHCVITFLNHVCAR